MSIPQPAFTVDFETGEYDTPEGYKLMEGAAIKDGAPGAVSRALRIDRDGPYAIFPNLDISPSKYPELSMIIEFYLESIPTGSKGWILNHDNGGYDRALVLHDSRFNGISHGVGYKAGPVYDTWTVPEVGKWIQMVVTYRQYGECAVFVSNEKAPITHTGRNNDGKSSLTLGRVVPNKNHWCDCWIKGVSIYDKGLSDEEVDLIFGKFKEEVIIPSEPLPVPVPVPEPEPINHGPVNVALGKTTRQSSTSPMANGISWESGNAVSGSTGFPFSCTANHDQLPWWTVLLRDTFKITEIKIFNNGIDKSFRPFLTNFEVKIGLHGNTIWTSGIIREFPNPEITIKVPGIVGDTASIHKSFAILQLSEFQVWGTPAARPALDWSRS